MSSLISFYTDFQTNLYNDENLFNFSLQIQILIVAALAAIFFFLVKLPPFVSIILGLVIYKIIAYSHYFNIIFRKERLKSELKNCKNDPITKSLGLNPDAENTYCANRATQRSDMFVNNNNNNNNNNYSNQIAQDLFNNIFYKK